MDGTKPVSNTMQDKCDTLVCVCVCVSRCVFVFRCVPAYRFTTPSDHVCMFMCVCVCVHVMSMWYLPEEKNGKKQDDVS